MARNFENVIRRDEIEEIFTSVHDPRPTEFDERDRAAASALRRRLFGAKPSEV